MTYGPKLTKAGLIEALKDYPDDTPVVVSNRIGIDPYNPEYRYLPGDTEGLQPVVWAVADAPYKIVLEL